MFHSVSESLVLYCLAIKHRFQLFSKCKPKPHTQLPKYNEIKTSSRHLVWWRIFSCRKLVINHTSDSQAFLFNLLTLYTGFLSLSILRIFYYSQNDTSFNPEMTQGPNLAVKTNPPTKKPLHISLLRNSWKAKSLKSLMYILRLETLHNKLWYVYVI